MYFMLDTCELYTTENFNNTRIYLKRAIASSNNKITTYR